jgi:carbonic anhydrase
VKTPEFLERIISRRTMIAGTGMTILAATGWARAAAALSDATGSALSAKEALANLKAGNERFASGQLHLKSDLAGARKKLVGGQKPFATILCCSDSRVPPEIIFDQSLGDIFVVRVAGNVVDTDDLGSIEYALLHLKSPLLVVVGHQKCGAVDAALGAMKGHADEPPNITALLKLVEPGLKGLDMSLPAQELLEAGVRANVQWSLKQLREAPEIKAMLERKTLGLAGGIYQLESGKVKFLEESIQL